MHAVVWYLTHAQRIRIPELTACFKIPDAIMNVYVANFCTGQVLACNECISEHWQQISLGCCSLIIDSIVVATGESKAALGPQPVEMQMVNCPLAAASRQCVGPATVGMTLQRAVEESLELRRAAKVLYPIMLQCLMTLTWHNQVAPVVESEFSGEERMISCGATWSVMSALSRKCCVCTICKRFSCGFKYEKGINKWQNSPHGALYLPARHRWLWTGHLQELIKSKALQGDKGSKGKMDKKSNSKSKSKSKKKKKDKGKKRNPSQMESEGPVNVEICNFDCANISGKYNLHLGAPAAALVCSPPSATASHNYTDHRFVTIRGDSHHSLCYELTCPLGSCCCTSFVFCAGHRTIFYLQSK
jgi:hypothetical protein